MVEQVNKFQLKMALEVKEIWRRGWWDKKCKYQLKMAWEIKEIWR
jgi:hypothetical protein